jgi:hypothetical protein
MIAVRLKAVKEIDGPLRMCRRREDEAFVVAERLEP